MTRPTLDRSTRRKRTALLAGVACVFSLGVAGAQADGEWLDVALNEAKQISAPWDRVRTQPLEAATSVAIPETVEPVSQASPRGLVLGVPWPAEPPANPETRPVLEVESVDDFEDPWDPKFLVKLDQAKPRAVVDLALVAPTFQADTSPVSGTAQLQTEASTETPDAESETLSDAAAAEPKTLGESPPKDPSTVNQAPSDQAHSDQAPSDQAPSSERIEEPPADRPPGEYVRVSEPNPWLD